MGSSGVDAYCQWLALYFFVPGHDVDDLFQEARIAAWLAPGHERIAARRRILDLLRFAQRRPLMQKLNEWMSSADVVEQVAAREQLRAIVEGDLTPNEQIALGRAARGEPIRREEKALGVAYWRARERLRYSEF